ncbi:MAG: hypothetical protein KAU28_03090 [Phycisphaerae bacterium]|nr:hypothetical protein [Phycisphaerae bacterium]
MRTLEDMRAALAGNLSIEDVDVANPERLTQLINRAKNHVVAMRDRYDRRWFISRKDYTVAQGDASVALPDGSGVEPAFRRLLGAKWIERAVEVPIYEYGDPQEKSTREAGFYLSREGRTLYFSPKTGAPAAMTLRVHYTGLVADLNSDDDAESFDRLEGDWCDLIEAYATILGVPGQRRDSVKKWEAVYASLLGNLGILAAKTLSVPRQMGLDPRRAQ